MKSNIGGILNTLKQIVVCLFICLLDLLHFQHKTELKVDLHFLQGSNNVVSTDDHDRAAAELHDQQGHCHGVEHDEEPTFFSLPEVSIASVDFLDHGRPVME